MITFFKNYFSTMSFISFWYFYYSNITYFQNELFRKFYIPDTQIVIDSQNIFLWLIIFYWIVLIPYYYFYNQKSKARIVINYGIEKIALKSLKKMSPTEKTALLSWVLKLFFAPLMIIWFMDHIHKLWVNIYLSYLDFDNLSQNFLLFFNKYLFMICFSTILFIDVLFFTLWYLFETPFFKNTIKSVQPTLIWWAVALICYPPFNSSINDFINWYSQNFPQFENIYIHLCLNIFILILMWIYSWASLSLWLKASNLTNRWIISKWPYKYIRHPAYTTKNLAWWIGWLPFIIVAFWENNFKQIFFIVLSLSVWTLIYYLRAKTEESHLFEDDDYKKYIKKVKYKFIPKIW